MISVFFQMMLVLLVCVVLLCTGYQQTEACPDQVVWSHLPAQPMARHCAACCCAIGLRAGSSAKRHSLHFCLLASCRGGLWQHTDWDVVTGAAWTCNVVNLALQLGCVCDALLVVCTVPNGGFWNGRADHNCLIFHGQTETTDILLVLSVDQAAEAD